MVLLLQILALTIFAFTAAGLNVKIKDDGCATYDSCSVGGFFRTCSCDEDCFQYGTCCSDFANIAAMTPEARAYSCTGEDTVTPTFAKNRCAEDYSGRDDVISACENGGSQKDDIMGSLLVSSNESLITYSNWNCAICNHEESSSILHWTVQVSCPASHNGINEESIRTKLVYAYRSWGMELDSRFVPCKVNFMQPDSLVNRLKYCAPNMISSCPSGYHDKNIIEKCQLYHAERKQRGINTYYKNPHCALCNSVPIRYLECFGRHYRPIIATSDEKVIKVLFKSGTWVGDEEKKYKCGEGEGYDPFINACRMVIYPSYSKSEACSIALSSLFSLYVVLLSIFVRY